jgi:hypothetical protein
MSHHELRDEKNCLNCGQQVEHRFCSNCGQENIQPRQTFGHLIAHFFEDITHYEGKFWGSLKLLFFKPGFLSKAYLEGKRNSYFAPVRLYIFVSFITFLLPGMLPAPPDMEGENHLVPPQSVAALDSTSKYEKADSALRNVFGDSVANHVKQAIEKNQQLIIDSTASEENDSNTTVSLGYGSKDGIRIPTAFNSMKEVDSAKAARKATDDPMGFLEYAYQKKAIELKHNKYPAEEQLSIFYEALKHNFPKALFIYMPLFALVLRLFHKRKNWIYFDHGIFTLHYFSFMLLAFTVMSILASITIWLAYLMPNSSSIVGVLWVFLYSLCYLSFPYYLLKAHQTMYGETTTVSLAKTIGILALNFVLFIAVFLSLVIVTLFTMH